MSDVSWLTTVQLPLVVQNPVKGTFRFHPSNKVDVIGSFCLEAFVRRHERIDIAVEMPQVIGLFSRHSFHLSKLGSYSTSNKCHRNAIPVLNVRDGMRFHLVVSAVSRAVQE